MESLTETEGFHATNPIDDPDTLDVVLLVDGDSNVLEVGLAVPPAVKPYLRFVAAQRRPASRPICASRGGALSIGIC